MALMTDMATPEGVVRKPWRIAAVGAPGTAKTGALASVINSGRYASVKIIDLDGNTEPLFEYIDREHWGKVDIQTVEEELDMVNAGAVWGPDAGDKAGKLKKLMPGDEIKPVGGPRAFRRVLALLNDWPGAGPSSTWASDTILVVDSATPLGRYADRKVMALTGHDSSTRTFDDQRQTNNEFLGLLERFKNQRQTPCNLYVTFHLKMIGPDKIQETKNQKMPELNKELLERAAELIPTKYYPNGPGKQCPLEAGGLFSTLIGFETIFEAGTVAPGVKFTNGQARVIRTKPKPELDIKVPVDGLPMFLNVETGLERIVRGLEGRE